MASFRRTAGFFLSCVLFLCALSPAASAKDPFIGYAAGGNSGRVLIFGIPSLTLLSAESVGIDVHGPVFSGSNKGNNNGTPDGKSLYVVDKATNSLLVFDLATAKPSKTIALPKLFGPNSLDLSPDGKTLCVAGELGGALAKVDLTTGKVETIALTPKPRAAVYAAVTKDGKFCLVSDYVRSVVIVASLSPFKVEKEIPVGRTPYGIVVLPDNSHALISEKFSSAVSFLDLSGLKIVKTIKTGAVPLHTVVDSSGTYAYQSHFVGGVITKIDLSKKEVVDTIPVQHRPAHLAITPDDKYLLVLNKYSTGIFDEWKTSLLPKGGEIIPNNFQLIDIDSHSPSYGKTVKQVPVPGEPFGAVVIQKEQVAGAAFGEGKEFLGKGAKGPDLPPKKGAKVSYEAVRTHKPGVFDAKGAIEIYLHAFSHQFAPNEVKNIFKGDTVRFIVTNIEDSGEIINHPDVVHGFTINGYGEQTNVLVPRGASVVLEFVANQSGEFDFYCSNFCGHAHMEMRGKFIVD